MRPRQSLQAAPGRRRGVYTQGGQIYGTFTVDQTTRLSAILPHSTGGPVVALPRRLGYKTRQLGTQLTAGSAERRRCDLTSWQLYYAHSLDDVSAKYVHAIRSVPMALQPSDLRHNLVMSLQLGSSVCTPVGLASDYQGWHITGSALLHRHPVSRKERWRLCPDQLGLDYPTQIGPIQKVDPHNPTHTFLIHRPSPVALAAASKFAALLEAPSSTYSTGRVGKHGLGVEKDTKITNRWRSTCASRCSTSSTIPTSYLALDWQC